MEKTNAQAALQAAIEFYRDQNRTYSKVVDLADAFKEWLDKQDLDNKLAD